MAKYDVTPELAEMIKNVRIQNHVSAKSVAEYIGKSQSYISKLEKGGIKSIQEVELSRILQYIYKDKEDFQVFLNNTLGKILDTLELRYSDKEIDEQLWFYNYDTVLRYIPIPGEMINDINSRMEHIHISCNEICERINSNEDISPEVMNTDSYPFNEWQAFIVNHQVKFQFIKMRIRYSEMEKILNKECVSCNYVTLLSLVYYLLKIENNLYQIEETEKTKIMNEAHAYLNSFRFYSLTEKNKLSQQAKTQSELDSLISSFDRENTSLLNEIILSFRVFSDIDIAKTNKYLETLVKNLKWDNSFTMAFIGLPFYDINTMGYTAKKHMLSEIQKIIEKYRNLPDAQKQLEVYE
ncbi:helix-turn-helix domain-containing protein [Pseudobutyrivibrio sp.]|uniref:helix-turn-helix domain-containing protein n=1 Tax=Pseudobutyrivibrio sp. TaxID=2014367 RepID=UPI0038657C02